MSPAGLCGSGGGRAESGAPRRPLSWPLPPVPLGDGEKKAGAPGKSFSPESKLHFSGRRASRQRRPESPAPRRPGEAKAEGAGQRPTSPAASPVRAGCRPRVRVRSRGRPFVCAALLRLRGRPVLWLAVSVRRRLRSWSIRSVAIPWRREGGEPTTPESGRGDLVALEESSRWGRRCRQEYPQGETWLVTWSELRRSESEIDGGCVCVCVCVRLCVILGKSV